MDLDLQTRVEGGWAVLDVAGEIDVYTAPKLRERLLDLVKAGRYRIVVNLEGVDFMDSTGLGVLVGGLKRVREHDGQLVLAGPQAPVRRVLAVTGLNKVFAIHASVHAALGASTSRS